MGAWIRKYWLPLACVAACLLKLVLCAGLPLSIHGEALYDDGWAVDAAESLAAGQWLGAYDDVTLIKNIGFPLYLALLIKLHIPYIAGTALLYILATVFFCLALKPLIKQRWLFLCVFVLILFCPVSFATDTFGRVYRNSITAAQVLLIFGAYLWLYVRLKGVKSTFGAGVASLIAPSLIGAVALAWFWLSREDSIWIAPFVAVATIVCLVLIVKRLACGFALRRVESGDGGVSGGKVAGAKPLALSVAGAIVAVVLLMLPVGATVVAKSAVLAANESAYGLATTAEINSGNFARFIKDLYAIEPDQMPENLHVACPHSSVERAYEASPTLASIQDYVEERFYNWGDKYDNDPGDGEVNGGEFFWVFRLAAAKAGLYATDGQALLPDAFWGACADEIEAAFASGALPQRSTMPSSIMTPWRAEYASLLVPEMAGIFWQSVCYADVTMQPFAAKGSGEAVDKFQTLLQGSGWWEGQDLPLACAVGTGIIWAYRILGPLLAIAGFVSFIALLVAWVRRRKLLETRRWLGPLVLVLAAILLSTFVLICGLTYTRVSSFTPINYYYYGSAAYVLLLAFNALGVAGLAEVLGRR